MTGELKLQSHVRMGKNFESRLISLVSIQAFRTISVSSRIATGTWCGKGQTCLALSSKMVCVRVSPSRSRRSFLLWALHLAFGSDGAVYRVGQNENLGFGPSTPFGMQFDSWQSSQTCCERSVVSLNHTMFSKM